MQYAWRWWPLDARHCAEVFVDRSNVVLGQTLIFGPGHDLQLVAGEWRRKTTRRLACRARRMQVIEVHSGSKDLAELIESVPTFGEAGFVGSQVARDNMRRIGGWQQRTKVSSASQVSRRIDLCWLAKIRVSAGKIFGLGTGRVAVIAAAAGINQITAQADKTPVFAFHVERHRCDFKAPLDS